MVIFVDLFSYKDENHLQENEECSFPVSYSCSSL